MSGLYTARCFDPLYQKQNFHAEHLLRAAVHISSAQSIYNRDPGGEPDHHQLSGQLSKIQQ